MPQKRTSDVEMKQSAIAKNESGKRKRAAPEEAKDEDVPVLNRMRASLNITARKSPVRGALIDSGAHVNIISRRLLTQLGVAFKPDAPPLLAPINGSFFKTYGRIPIATDIEDDDGDVVSRRLTFEVADLGYGTSILLGMPWLQGFQPVCNWVLGTWKWPSCRIPTLPSGKRLFVDIIFSSGSRRLPYRALIDTGCTVNHMSHHLVELLRLRRVGPGMPRRAINGSPIALHGEYQVDIEVEDDVGRSKTTCHMFYGSKGFVDDYMILGYNWLRTHQPVFDWANGTWTYPVPRRRGWAFLSGHV